MLLGLACSLFAAGASGGVLMAHLVLWPTENAAFLMKLSAKTFFFSIFTLFFLYFLRKNRPFSSSLDEPQDQYPAQKKRILLTLGIPLLLAAAVVFPRLNAYPWPAPDETFHLTMARNVAAHGQYASGNPEAGFVMFDGYASVGPPVILPVAASVKLFGPSLIAGRLVIGLYFIGLCAAVYFLLRPVFGDYAAGLSVVMITLSSFSTYLSRSLYGEVPALFFIVMALIFWRKALARKSLCIYDVLTGILFAFALMSKLFLVISAPVFLAVYLGDLMSEKRIRIVHVFAPAVSFALVFGLWLIIQAICSDKTPGTGAQSNAIQHLHYLLFGFKSFGRAALWIFKQCPASYVLLCAVTFVVLRLMRQKHDAPLLIFFTLSPFFVFWWLFFTTGAHHRYMFYAWTIALTAAGPLLVALVRSLRKSNIPLIRKVLLVAALLIVIEPPITHAILQFDQVYRGNEAGDDLALAEYVKNSIHPGKHIVTTYYPVSRTLDFLTGRNVELIREMPSNKTEFDLIIVDSSTQSHLLLEDFRHKYSFGRYVLVSSSEIPERESHYEN